MKISYFPDLKVYPVPLLFFLRASKILMRLSVFFFEGFRLQNVLIMLLFFTKNAYLLMAKITLDVYNCL